MPSTAPATRCRFLRIPPTAGSTGTSDGVIDEVSGTVVGVNNGVVTPTAAEVRDGAYVVTSLQRVATITRTVEGICVDGDIPPEITSVEGLSVRPAPVSRRHRRLGSHGDPLNR